MTKSTEKAFKCGRMDRFTKATGLPIKLVAMVDLFTWTATCTAATGAIISLTGMEHTRTKMDLSTKGNGRMISNMAKVRTGHQSRRGLGEDPSMAMSKFSFHSDRNRDMEWWRDVQWDVQDRHEGRARWLPLERRFSLYRRVCEQWHLRIRGVRVEWSS